MVLLHHFVINRGVVIGLRVHPRPLVHLHLTERKVLDRPAKTFLVRRGLRKPRLLGAYDLSFFGSTHGVAAGDSHSAEPPPPPPLLLLLAVVAAVLVVVRGSGLGSSSGSANDVTYQAAQPDQTLRLCKPREEGGGGGWLPIPWRGCRSCPRSGAQAARCLDAATSLSEEGGKGF